MIIINALTNQSTAEQNIINCCFRDTSFQESQRALLDIQLVLKDLFQGWG